MRNTIQLDGIWNFGFQNIPLEQATPDTIPTTQVTAVPGCFDVKPPLYAQRGTGLYARTVSCGGKVRLTLAAMGLTAKVFWDRQEIARCDHPFSPEIIRFDAGHKGTHTLAIAVENITHPPEEGGMFLADYDFHCYAGLYDSVTLEELPDTYLDRVQVTPMDLEGLVQIKLILAGKPRESSDLAYCFDGGTWQYARLQGTSATFTANVPNPTLWSTDSPNLHHLRVVLDPGRETDAVETTFGIRTIEAKHGKILLNGKPITLIGYNRHDSHPDFGYALPAKTMLEDLKMIKGQGCNFIRGAHYPQREAFLELCDRMGILVWEEVLGWNNQPNHVRHPKFQRLELEQATAMVRKSANHPSVIMWGFLNEVYMPEGQSPRELITALIRTIRQEDSSRPITFAFATAWIDSSDNCLDLPDILAFNTYPGWYGSWDQNQALDTVVPMLRKLADKASETDELRNKPLIISEIGAAAILNDHSGVRWSEDYQADLLERTLREILDNPRYSGLAIWQFSDTRTHLDTAGILSKPGGFNNKGVVTAYRIPKMAFATITRMLREQNAHKA